MTDYLPTWAIQSYACGNGPEAALARMLLRTRHELEHSRQEIDCLYQDLSLTGRVSRKLMEEIIVLQERRRR